MYQIQSNATEKRHLFQPLQRDNVRMNDVSQWHFTTRFVQMELKTVASEYRASKRFEDIRRVGLRTDSSLTVTQDF